MTEEMRVFLERRPFSGRISMYLYHDNPDGAVSYARGLVMERVPLGMHAPASPTAELSVASAQALMDALWDCGLRPSDGSGSAGALAATQDHLKDMRAVAFAQLGINHKTGDVIPED